MQYLFCMLRYLRVYLPCCHATNYPIFYHATMLPCYLRLYLHHMTTGVHNSLLCHNCHNSSLSQQLSVTTALCHNCALSQQLSVTTALCHNRALSYNRGSHQLTVITMIDLYKPVPSIARYFTFFLMVSRH